MNTRKLVKIITLAENINMEKNNYV